MKKVILFLVLILVINTYAQRAVNLTENMDKDEEVFLNFKFANDIQVLQWDKNQISIKATVNINEGEGDEFFSLLTERSKSQIEIRSDFGDYFKNRNKNGSCNDCCNNTTEISYVVYVPSNIHLKVKSISGNLKAENFTGNLDTDLVSGDVLITGFKGELLLKTVSGDLDVRINSAQIDAKTLTGTIYSDLEIDFLTDHPERSSGYNKVVGTVNKGNQTVKLQTVSGDIFMRKG